MAIILARLGTVALVGLATFGSARPSPAATPFPSATWQTEDGRARVRTERCGATADQLCGYVVWLQNPRDGEGKTWIDRKNPDAGKQDRPVLGHQILLGLRPNPESHYEGQVYNADNGKSYDVAVWSDVPTALVVKGCVFVFCGTQIWSRVTDVLPGQLHGVTGLPGGPRNDPAWATKPVQTGSIPFPKARSAGE